MISESNVYRMDRNVRRFSFERNLSRRKCRWDFDDSLFSYYGLFASAESSVTNNLYWFPAVLYVSVTSCSKNEVDS